jgi:glycosyltransferase involved in cell wall biosynthesis
MPSLHEGLSILSIEAAMCRLPNIINACEGLADTLPEDWPLKVQDNNLNAYKWLFDNVLPSIDVVALGLCAAGYAKQYFSIQQMQQAYEQIYLNPTNS